MASPQGVATTEYGEIFLGDGFMAIFGVSDEEGHASKAVRAAFAMLVALEKQNEEWEKNGMEKSTRVLLEERDLRFPIVFVRETHLRGKSFEIKLFGIPRKAGSRSGSAQVEESQ